MHAASHDFVVVANRLPVDRVVDANGRESWRRSPGGLVTAMAPVLRQQRGAWVGWTGAADDAPEPFAEDGLELLPVKLSGQDVDYYYEGFSNATLWPLYHDVIVPAQYHRTWWDSYVSVNERFAAAAAESASNGATVWVHDYQLQLVPRMLRRQRPDLRIGFFLHIPFPPPELFAQLPWRREIVEGLLGADLVGFQRGGGAANFVALCNHLLGLRVHGDTVHTPDGRQVPARTYPISIDTTEITDLAADEDVRVRAAEMRHELGDPDHLLLGVDRLDYTKGIPHRLQAFQELLEDGALDPVRAVFVQLAVPSRERVSAYAELRDEIERVVGRINGEFGAVGHTPVQYLHSGYDRPELVAMLLAADVMLVTPLRDGMNLVAKEYVAAHADGRGALVLSEFAGAADELSQAWLVNPHDIDWLKASILHALHASPEERQRRMLQLHAQVVEHDVQRWAAGFLADLRD